MNEYVILAGRIREALNEVNMVVERALSRRARAQELGDIGWEAVALNLHGFYTAVERILEALDRQMDG